MKISFAILLGLLFASNSLSNPNEKAKQHKEKRNVLVSVIPISFQAPKEVVHFLVTSSGQFKDRRGSVVSPKELVLFYADCPKEKPLAIAVIFDNEEKTSMAVVGKTIATLAESSRDFPNVAIYIRVELSMVGAKKMH